MRRSAPGQRQTERGTPCLTPGPERARPGPAQLAGAGNHGSFGLIQFRGRRLLATCFLLSGNFLWCQSSLINPAPGCRFEPRCPFAIDECRRITPQLGEVAPSQFAACHVALMEARTQSPAAVAPAGEQAPGGKVQDR